MATAKKAGGKAAKTADISKPLKSDPRHPDVHPERHTLDGLQEPNTAGLAATAEVQSGETPVGQPNPVIGADAPAKPTQPGSLSMDPEALADQDYVWSLDQAQNLPVVESGSPIKMPSDSQLKSLRSKLAKEQGESSVEETGDDVADKKARVAAVKNAEKTMEHRTPVVSFKDKDRRTMVVVKTKNGLAAAPSKLYQDVEAA